MATYLIDAYQRLVRRRILLRGGRSQDRVISGRRLHYYELVGRGSGPPLVLLHGMGGAASSFIHILFALRDRWSRIYVPDLPGHGLSPLDPLDPPLDARGHGELFYAFLQEVVGHPAVLVGNSLGGALSMGVALEKPEAVAGLGLLSPAGAPLTAEHVAELRERFAVRSRRDALAFIMRLTHRPLPGAFLVASDLREVLRGPAVRNILAQMDTQQQLDPASLRALKIPVTLVWGASERILPFDDLEFFRANLPRHARIEVFERCGHVPMMEQPARTLRVLSDLAAEVERRPMAAARASVG
jgi:pimeloyl-ACP methyl ester carboxylesterase